MDYTQAQDAYNLALKEYEASLNNGNIYSNNAGQLLAKSALRQTPTGMQGYIGYGGIGGLRNFSPLAGGTTNPNAQANLDAARAALEQARAAQSGALNQRYDRFTQQARDALYQGMKSYQPQALLSPSGNQYDVPQGNLSMYSNRIKSLLGG